MSALRIDPLKAGTEMSIAVIVAPVIVGVILLLAMLVTAICSGCLGVPIAQERKKLTASVTNPLDKRYCVSSDIYTVKAM